MANETIGPSLPASGATAGCISVLFFLLVGAQAARSVEEYLTRLYGLFSVVSGAIHRVIEAFPVIRMARQSFAILNVALGSGLLLAGPSVLVDRARGCRFYQAVAKVEIREGLRHRGAAICLRGYFPGAATAAGSVVVNPLLVWSRLGTRGREMGIAAVEGRQCSDMSAKNSTREE
jgi:hypothetical protein